MSEADLGVRVFLIDNLSSPMSLVTDSVAMLGSMLVSGSAQAAQMAEQMAALTTRMAEQQAALVELTLDEDMYNAQLAKGLITQDEYDVAMADNAIAQQKAMESIDATSAATADLQQKQADLAATLAIVGFTLGAGIDFFAFAEGMKQADQAASDLQNTMNSVSIAGNLTNQQLVDMQGYLMQVASTSIYTADQVGQGFSLLEEKGYSATQIEKGLGQQSINLSMAIGDQNSGTTGSVNLLATAMEVMRAKASDAGKYADLLTFAFYHGIPSVDGLRSALEQVGGRASMMKIPFDQLVVALDQLGRAGMTGQQAGAALNYALQALYAPIQKTQHELEYLGIITVGQHLGPQLEHVAQSFQKVGASMPSFDGTIKGLDDIFAAGQKVGAIPLSATFYQWAVDNGLLSNAFYNSNGSAKDLITNLGILYQKLKDKTPEEKAAAFQQLFNVRSSQGVTQLMDALGKVNETYQGLTQSQDALGLATEDATKRMDSQSAQAQALKTTFTDFLAQVGKPIQDFMQGFFASLNRVVGALTTGNPVVHQFFTSFLIVGTISAGVGLFIGLILLIGTFAGAIVAPVLLAAGAIAAFSLAVAGAVTLIQQHWSTIAPIVKPAMDGIQHGLQGVAHWAGLASDALNKINTPKVNSTVSNDQKPIVVRPPITKDLPDTIDRTHGAVLRLQAALPALADSMDRTHGSVLGLLPPAKTFGDTFDRAPVVLKNTAQAANPLVPVFQAVGSMFSWLGSLMSGEVGQAFKQIQPELKPLGQSFKDLLVALKPLLPVIGMFAAIIIGILIGALTGLIRGLSMLILGITTVLHGLILGFTGLIQFFHGFFDVVTGIFTLNGDKIKHGFSLMWEGIKNVVSAVITIIKGLLIGFFGTIGGLVTGFVEGIIGFFKHLFDALVGHSIIPDMIRGIIGWFVHMITLIPALIGGWIHAILGLILSLSSQAISHIQSMVSGITSTIGGLIGNAFGWGKNLIQGFINGIGSMIGNVRSAVSNVVSNVAGFLGFHSPAKEGPGATADQWMPNLMHMLTIGIHGGIPALRSAASSAADALHGGFYSPGIGGAQRAYATASASINGGNTTVPINIDGHEVTTVVLNRLTGQLQMSGSGRLLR